MSCVDADDNNKVICKAVEGSGKPNVCVIFGLYINWGRPNHNDSRITFVIRGLQEKGYGVRIKHLQTDRPHAIAIAIEEGEEEIVSHDEIQHNKHYSNLKSNSEALVRSFEEELKKRGIM